MKIKYLFAITLCFTIGTLYAQSIQLLYDYSNIGLGENRSLTLTVNGNESLTTFSSKDSIAKSEEEIKDFDLGGEDKIGRQFYKNTNTNQIVFRDFVSIDGRFVPCIVQENMVPFSWTYTANTKKIGSYICKSASVSFRGRTYFVWFSEDLPISHGPWKFYGLPGGIVEIQSADKNVSFVLKKVQTLPKAEIYKPTNGKVITFVEYVKLKDDAVKDFLKSLAAKLPRGAQIDLASVKDYNLELDFGDTKK